MQILAEIKVKAKKKSFHKHFIHFLVEFLCGALVNQWQLLGGRITSFSVQEPNRATLVGQAYPGRQHRA